MFSESPRERPRHLAGADRAGRSLSSGADPVARATPAIELEPDEVSLVARVKRSRMAFAVAVTLAALPILALDNLPATAETDQDQVEAIASDSSEAPPSTTVTSAPPSTTTTVAPTTTAAPPTTEAPTTTEAVVQLQAAAPAPTTTVAPPTTPPAPPVTAPPTSSGGPNDPATWEGLARCESGGNWALNSGNGYYGGLQFSLATWKNVGGAGYPHQASKAEQINRGKILQARAGWGQWPHCARTLGLL